ncbi:PH domain-containing protein [Pseudonocardia kujensis]|uniref:PH domain-containing protein n=1 Tax=Pseudonocardia kujensis TaxID=1128675 RepID=UPI001E4AB1A4|nr:PH domain-containing protein [Pseudonocardia kujensis]MCE0764056.1 PH domain-containing protein [Pseudonocardia kujensis]
MSGDKTSRPGIAEGHVASADKLAPRAVPTRLSFRRSPLALAAAAFFLVAAIPFAFGAPWLWLVYVLPLAFAYWIVRVRTVVDADSVTVRRLLSAQRVPWAEISSLRLGKKSRVSAVLTDGTELPLPTVHVRDLPALAAVSGGRLPDPAQTEARTPPARTPSEPPSTPERT